MYRWMSDFTGEVQKNLFQVIKEVVTTIREVNWPLSWKIRYVFQWKYNRSGF